MRLLRTFLVSSCLATAPSAQLSQDTSVGCWPFLVGNMDSSIVQLVNDTLTRGLDTIYINAYRATGPSTGTLWITDSAGSWPSAWGAVRPGNVGIDLPALIQQAHLRNLQVVAVIKCFDDTVQPDNAAHRAYLLGVVDYLVDSFDASGRPVYDLDGIALDYIRYVDSGCSGKDATLVTNLVRDIKQRLGALSLHAYLLAGRYTFDGPTYDSSFNSYASVIATNRNCYGQDWEQLARHLDVMMPMAYTADGSIYSTYAAHQSYVRQVASYAVAARQQAGATGTRVVITVRTYDTQSETCTAATVDASVTGALAGGADGYSAFRWGTLQGRNDWWNALAAHAVPGSNRPIPVFTASTAGLGTVLDPQSSRDSDEPASGLQVRFTDTSAAAFDSGWLPSARTNALSRGPGSWRVDLQVRDADGHLGATRRRIDVPPVLSLDRTTFSVANGGSVQISLACGPQTNGYAYLITGGLSGTQPGTPLAPAVTLPLNVDGLTIALVQSVNSPLLANGAGGLNFFGQATATFYVPPNLLWFLAGSDLHWAALGADAQGDFVFVSNPALLRLVP